MTTVEASTAAMAGASGKAEKGERAMAMASRPYNAVKAHGNGAQQLLHASATPKLTTNASGSQKKLAVGEVSPAVTVHHIYRIATRLISQITPKFVWQLKNLQK